VYFYKKYLDAVRPEEIYYLSNHRQVDADKDLDYLVLKCFCESLKLPLVVHFLSEQDITKRFPFRLNKIKLNVREYINGLGGKVVHDIVLRLKNVMNKGQNILYLSTGYNLKSLMREQQKLGAKIWIYNIRRRIICLPLLGGNIKHKITTNKKLAINSNSLDKLSHEIGVVLGIKDGIIWGVLNRALDNYIIPSLEIYRFFAENPNILSLFDEVVSQTYILVGLNAVFLYLYKQNPVTKRTLLCHGEDGAFSEQFQFYHDFLFSNRYICEDTGTMKMLNKYLKTKDVDVEFIYKKLLFEPFRKLKRNKARKRKIIYLPTFFWVNQRYLNGANYEDVYYYKLQKAIIDCLSQHPEYEFVWKQKWWVNDQDPVMHKYIKDRRIPNVKYSFKPLFDELKDCYALITDYPSTGMYEAAAAGVPVFGIYPKWFQMHDETIEYWGKNLEAFSNIEEALELINRFLSSDISKYAFKI
jgi:hypothetical protein